MFLLDFGMGVGVSEGRLHLLLVEEYLTNGRYC